jgi:hypothetical protein
MILTRYLYQKHHVEFSMFCTLFSKNKEETNFWAYELYFSGFKQETLELLIKCFKTHYIEKPWFSKVEKYILEKYEEWKKNNTHDFIVSTIIENIIKADSVNTPKAKILLVKLSELDILKYKSSPFISGKGWKMPRRLCTVACREDPKNPFTATIHDYWEWLYYASGSPIWKTKIIRYGGEIDHENKTIIFHDEDKEEDFRMLYDMEPDEQPSNVLANWGIKPYFGTN